MLALAKKFSNPDVFGDRSKKPALPQITDIDWADIYDNGKPKQTMENTSILMQQNGVKLSINDMSHEIEQEGLEINGSSIEDEIRVNIEDLAIQNNMSFSRIGSLIKPLAYKNKYHPWTEYLNSLDKWDGEDRISELLSSLTLTESSQEYFNTSLMLLKKWLLSLVAAVKRKQGDPPLRLTLVFAGKQHIGKTTFFKKIFTDHTLFKESMHLETSNKDLVFEATKYLCCELGEIDSTFSKAGISRLKAFLSREQDEARLPYEKGTTKYLRKTVFCGTVNDSEFLVDQTGNSRFAVIDIQKIDYEKYNSIDRSQLWSQVLHLFNAGELWTLDSKEIEILNKRNLNHTETPFITTLVHTKYAWDCSKVNWRWLAITEVAEELDLSGAMIRNSKSQKELKITLSELLKSKEHSRKRTMIYFIPPLLDGHDIKNRKRGIE